MPLKSLIKYQLNSNCIERCITKNGDSKGNYDGPEFKGEFKHILQSEGIEHIVFTTHLSFIDRFTRTIKNMLFERVEHTGKSWHLLLPAVINQ